MPTVNEEISISVLLRAFMRGRLSRWGYYKTFIEISNARLILVWHDTNLEAYQLQHHIGIPIWCIQNGVRHDIGPHDGVGLLTGLRELGRTQRPSVTKYFGFSESTEQLLAPLLDAKFISTGSYRLNEYIGARDEGPIHKQSLRNKVGLIVSFPNGSEVPNGSIRNNHLPFIRVGTQVISFNDYFSLDALVAQAIQRVSARIGLEFAIIGKRSSRDSIERRFFAQVPGCEQIEVLAHEKGYGYDLAESFEYLITVDSTLGYEMLAAGKRVGFVSNRFRYLGLDAPDLAFGYPVDLPPSGPCWTNATDAVAIEHFVERIVSSSTGEWNQIHQEIAPRVMALDPANSQLRKAIVEQLGHTI